MQFLIAKNAYRLTHTVNVSVSPSTFVLKKTPELPTFIYQPGNALLFQDFDKRIGLRGSDQSESFLKPKMNRFYQTQQRRQK